MNVAIITAPARVITSATRMVFSPPNLSAMLPPATRINEVRME
jgi:hypothetical protein